MFLYQSLLWIGLPLVALPILIHLINMVRHRHVKWAAMEFLLESQQKHRTWIVFKQLLLLLLRTAAIAVLVMMLAQPILNRNWGPWFGNHQLHHVVLLDDSFSMSDQGGDGSVFERATQFLREIIQRSRSDENAPNITLLRFSEAAKSAGSPDLLQETTSSKFSERYTRLLDSLKPSETDAGPLEAVTWVDEQLDISENEHCLLYVVSDFRKKEWNQVADLRQVMLRLVEKDIQIHLVDCAETVQQNLAITGLRPASGIQAAGVEMLMELSVQNFGPQPAEDVLVRIENDHQALPALLLDHIEPRETVTRVFRVRNPTAGSHTVVASLPEDAIAADNHRYYILTLPNTLEVLLLDSAPRAEDAYFLASALAPGGNVHTGLKTRIESPKFLADEDDLSRFTAICLLNLDDLQRAGIERLESYVASGGGAAFFLGERSGGQFFNQKLYRNGAGLFPVPLTVPTDLLVDRLQTAPDLEVADHPIFAVFAGQRNSFLDKIFVQRYFGVPSEWSSEEGTSKVLARLRNRAPLIVEKRFGQGRVVAQLSKISPTETTLGSWNNWGRDNPSFVVAMLELIGYLASTRHIPPPCQVGQPLRITVNPQEYQRQVRLRHPARDGVSPVPIDIQPDDGSLTFTFLDTTLSGVYEVVLVDLTGLQENRLIAYNVAAEEGDLDHHNRGQLSAKLADVDHHFYRANDLYEETHGMAGVPLSDTLLGLLIVLLLGEQWLAYRISYHLPKPKRGLSR